MQHLYQSLRVAGERPAFSHVVFLWGRGAASRGQSVGRHHLVVYEPSEGCVSARFNGLLYSLACLRGSWEKQRGRRLPERQLKARLPTEYQNITLPPLTMWRL